MDKHGRRVAMSLTGAVLLVLVVPRTALADMAGGSGLLLLGLGALVIAVPAILLSLVALFVIIHYLRKDRRERGGRSARPVPPQEGGTHET